MKIILFRHGEKQHVDSTKIDDKQSVQLTDLGIHQIEKLGHILSQRFPQLKFLPIIYSSFYARSIQSAQIIQSILKIKKIVQVSEFGEFSAYTNFNNPKSIRQHLQETALQNPDWISPETKVSQNQAISNFLVKVKEIYSQNQPDYILISTHGAIIRTTVYSLEPKYRPNNNLILSTKIHEGGYTVLNFDGHNFTVDQFDVHDFLD